jgi:hypothetical protein
MNLGIVCIDCGNCFLRSQNRQECSGREGASESGMCEECKLARLAEQQGGGRDNSLYGDIGGAFGSSYNR